MMMQKTQTVQKKWTKLFQGVLVLRFRNKTSIIEVLDNQ